MHDSETAQRLYLSGIEELEHGRDEEALLRFNQSFNFCEHPKTAQMISQILYKMKQDQAAFQYLERAYSIGANNDSIAFCYAEQLEKRGEQSKAEHILRELLARNCTYKKAKLLLEKITQK